LKNVYIGGDSFCYYRQEHDWPYIVAKLLNRNLRGRGFPGDSWWHTKKHLTKYLDSSWAKNTDIYIFCHTDPYRPLTGQTFSNNPEAEVIKNQYYKYFVDYDVSLWAVQHWYQELNNMMTDHTVLHFQSFNTSSDVFQQLNGTRVLTPLVELSLGGKSWNEFMNDSRHNHFDTEHNKKFAELVIQSLSSNQNNLEISF